MKKLELDDILGLERYEQARPELRKRIIGMKKNRRVSVGDRVTFVFENRETMRFQVQEMVRAERIVDLDKLRDELEVYNELIPAAGELSATMLIEITEADKIRDELVQLIGIDEAVRLEIGDPAGGGFSAPGMFEAGHSREDKLSAVQYVRFRLEPAAKKAFLDDNQPARLVIEHPNYRHSARVEDNVRRSLMEDLEAA